MNFRHFGTALSGVQGIQGPDTKDSNHILQNIDRTATILNQRPVGISLRLQAGLAVVVVATFVRSPPTHEWGRIGSILKPILETGQTQRKCAAGYLPIGHV